MTSRDDALNPNARTARAGTAVSPSERERSRELASKVWYRDPSTTILRIAAFACDFTSKETAVFNSAVALPSSCLIPDSSITP